MAGLRTVSSVGVCQDRDGMTLKHRGQELSEFLDELGIREDVEAQAIKEILADQVLAAMREGEALEDRHGGPDGDQSPRARSSA